MSSEDASLLCQPVDTAPPNPTPLSQGSAPNGVVDQTPASVSHLQPTNTAEAPRPSAAAPALEQHATSTTGNVKGTGESISSVPSLSVAGLVENKNVNKLVDVATFTETKAVGAGAVATGLTCLPCRLAKVSGNCGLISRPRMCSARDSGSDSGSDIDSGSSPTVNMCFQSCILTD
jgi:hypothetical protein